MRDGSRGLDYYLHSIKNSFRSIDLQSKGYFKANFLSLSCLLWSGVVVGQNVGKITTQLNSEKTQTHTHARTHARSHARMHARTHARAHTHTHTQTPNGETKNKTKMLVRTEQNKSVLLFLFVCFCCCYLRTGNGQAIRVSCRRMMKSRGSVLRRLFHFRLTLALCRRDTLHTKTKDLTDLVYVDSSQADP